MHCSNGELNLSLPECLEVVNYECAGDAMDQPHQQQADNCDYYIKNVEKVVGAALKLVLLVFTCRRLHFLSSNYPIH